MGRTMAQVLIDEGKEIGEEIGRKRLMTSVIVIGFKSCVPDVT